jgi:hypothetical protein
MKGIFLARLFSLNIPQIFIGVNQRFSNGFTARPPITTVKSSVMRFAKEKLHSLGIKVSPRTVQALSTVHVQSKTYHALLEKMMFVCVATLRD